MKGSQLIDCKKKALHARTRENIENQLV